MRRIRYKNLDDVANLKSFTDMRRWMKERRQKVKDLSKQIPHAQDKQVEFLQMNRSEQSITWIGHATFLIQMGGLNILTDPVWAGRMGLQKRLTEPGLALDQLPSIDLVLISHGHYDHLDFPTIRKLPGSPLFLVPIGLRKLFLRKGIINAFELSWWDSYTIESLTITFVPAQHWTRRSLFDTNTSHWGGWIVQDNRNEQTDQWHETVYFVGDTGYFRGFRMIAEKFKTDIVLMPIGAYEPEWFMKESHINPEDAVMAFHELRAKRMIPMHYGTYRLADDTGPEALERLTRAWEEQKTGDRELHILKIGETLRI